MVKFTLKTEYAIKALIHIANSNEPVSSSQIYNNEGIPMAFLEQILVKLRRGGIVRSVRGKKGGYVLAASPREISLLNIIEAIEGKYGIVKCLTPGEEMECMFSTTACVLKSIWYRVQDKLVEILESITLKDLMEDYRKSSENLKPYKLRP